jgi:hypothetical protein
VEVSLCGQVITSALASATGVGASPGGAECTIGSSKKGASAVTVANFCENSPHTRWTARLLIKPQAAASQKAVDPPLPSMTS